MKKIFLFLLINFLFVGHANANNIETQLTDLQNNIKTLENEVKIQKDTRIDKMYPIGSIYTTTTYSTVDEVSAAIGGTWERYGNGKSLVGVDSSDEDFNVVEKTGGSSLTTLTTNNLPSHNHTIPSLSGTANNAGTHSHTIPSLSGSTNSAGSHTHALRYANDGGNLNVWGIVWQVTSTTKMGSTSATAFSGDHSHTVTTNASTSGNAGDHSHTLTTTESITKNTGSGTAFTNLQPYITVYMYKRVA